MRHIGDELKGPLYKHLGHFAEPRYANDGHNSEMENIPEMAKANFNIVSNRDTMIYPDREHFASKMPHKNPLGAHLLAEWKREDDNKPVRDDMGTGDY